MMITTITMMMVIIITLKQSLVIVIRIMSLDISSGTRGPEV